jgi:hypothetical protein
MSKEAPSPAESAGYALFAFALGLFLYFFGLGPVAYASLHFEISPALPDLYFAPLAWLPENNTLSNWIGAYIELWTGPQC